MIDGLVHFKESLQGIDQSLLPMGVSKVEGAQARKYRDAFNCFS